MNKTQRWGPKPTFQKIPQSSLGELPLEGNSLAQIRHSKESIKFDFTWYLLRNSAGDTLCSISDLLENVVPGPHNLIILGDFNIHVDDQCDPSTLRFTGLLDSFDLENKASSPTHTSGHTLDLVITRSNSRIDVTSVLADHFLSDHCFIHTSLICTSVEFDRKTMVYRNINRIDMDEFKKDLSQSALCDDNLNDLHSIISTYGYSLKTLLDKHTPVKSKTVTIKPSQPWFTSSLNSFKRVRRQLEKKWLCSRTQDDLNAFKKARNDFIAACDDVKRGYFSRQVQDCKGDQKKLFLLINKLTFRSTSNQLPPSIDNKSLADGFGEFFQKKVNRIASDVSIMCTNEAFQPIADQFSCADITEFSNFATLSQADVLKLINKSASKHCILDPVPTKIVKECIEILLPVITNIINLCMEHGEFPECWRCAVVVPILKKRGLPLDFPNYRPVSNLPYLSKLVESAVMEQFQQHMFTNNLLPANNSAYRKHHSTETTLLRVYSDILNNMDVGKVTVLLMLDLSAAFDTVNYHLLFDNLVNRVNIKGLVLKWFQEYLCNRRQKVLIDGMLSKDFFLKQGVPQGSCTGPMLFITYLSQFYNVMSKHLPCCQGYADDSQFYLAFNPNDDSSKVDAISAIENCVADARRWFLTILN
ncbi:RNA-directed DNA polymerase from mobile element jockey [Holothuria leucospilota]|uniref:RNA-directed DNA polymerase from mobile element jockey n=1 Tax=Holothuria leucospilota TaxID=206669 RepID=A0A9Q0Y9H6_HOLLE|nr:RNA-directed DNA polymerase from mobile element jockey [Holothuria leucospilota]